MLAECSTLKHLDLQEDSGWGERDIRARSLVLLLKNDLIDLGERFWYQSRDSMIMVRI